MIFNKLGLIIEPFLLSVLMIPILIGRKKINKNIGINGSKDFFILNNDGKIFLNISKKNERYKKPNTDFISGAE